MLDHEQFAEKQTQLTRALETAYLNHQISELEDKVRRLPTSQNQTGQATGVKKDQTSPRVEAKKQIHRIDDDHSIGRVGPRRFEEDERYLGSDDEGGDEEWRVAVVDVSALLWAPKATRNLVAKGFEVIVPLNGIETLDLLKKGNSPSAQAARAATRYIEHASRQHKLLSIDPSITVQLGTNYKRGVGLRIQQAEEYRQADELSSLPLMPGEEGPPKWVQSVLGCAAYFLGINKAELHNSFHQGDLELPPALYVASPPIEILIAEDPTGVAPQTREMREQAEKNGSYHERGEGVVVLEEAERFEIGIEILRDDDDEIMAMRRSGRGGRVRGRGGSNGNTNGHGHGYTNGNRPQGKPRRKEEEKQPEVKILLKRPPQPPPPQVDHQVQPSPHGNGLDQNTSASGDSPPTMVRSLLFPDIGMPPPAGLTVDANGNTAGVASLAMTKSNSNNSLLSNEISPPNRGQKKFKSSPPLKFVPLSRETHPVQRRADDSSSDSDHSRHGRGNGRGRGGGRGGRGSGGRGGTSGGGSGRRRKERERDGEFKNGNFTLLQRPQPPPSTAPVPVVASAQTPTTILARPVSSRPPKKPSTPATAQPPSHGHVHAQAQAPRTAAPPVRAILQRPPRGPGPGSGADSNGPPARPPSAAPAPGQPIARDMQASWGARGAPPTPFRPQFVNPQTQTQEPSTAQSPSLGLSATAPAFEFDDAMLKPGYGSADLQPHANGNGNGNGYGRFPMNGPGHGRGHGRGRGGFGPGRGHGHGHGPFHHHHHHHHHRPPPFANDSGNHLHNRPPGVGQWQPTQETLAGGPSILQRPK